MCSIGLLNQPDQQPVAQPADVVPPADAVTVGEIADQVKASLNNRDGVRKHSPFVSETGIAFSV